MAVYCYDNNEQKSFQISKELNELIESGVILHNQCSIPTFLKNSLSPTVLPRASRFLGQCHGLTMRHKDLTINKMLRILIAFVKERFHNAVEIDILGIFEGYLSLQIWPPQKIFQGRNYSGRMT